MPFNTYPYPRKKISSAVTPNPFALIPVSVDVSSASQFVTKNDFDCACPCNDFVPVRFITSSKLLKFSKAPLPQITSAKPRIKKAVKISINSYLFKGILPPVNFSGGKGYFFPSDPNDNPTIKLYGLNVPIILDGFLDLSDQNSKNTLKVWLTCCYSSGETVAINISSGASFASCKSTIGLSDEISSCAYKGLIPQTAFISASTTWPETLITRKIVNRGSEATPLYDKRAIEVHIPIGEVSVKGSVIVQYLKQNLVLSDMCINGTPAKVPMAMYNEGTILPVSF